MEISGYIIPDELLYTKEHEWAKATKGTILVGITDYAAKTLNDVVYVTLPKHNEEVKQFKSMGTVESIKAVSELYSPVSGTVTKTNEALQSHPELVNSSPYEEGWLVEVTPEDYDEERINLLDPKRYSAHVESLIKT